MNPDGASAALSVALNNSPAPECFSVFLQVSGAGYGNKILFDALELTLPAGETTCLLGPSGVGKSTLLRLLAGLMPLGESGRIECGDGESLRGRIAYMDQRDLLLPWLCVVDNVALGARLRGEPPRPEHARELLRAVGLETVADELPAHLSGGMRQRVALARTLMEARPVVLMDEPFSALDAVTRFQLQALSCELLRGRTALLVTHDPNEALRLGHRIQVLSQNPVRLSEPLTPPGPPPRDPSAQGLRQVQRILMQQLGMVCEP